MNCQILPEAEADLEQAFDFYASRRPELGQQFIAEFRRAIEAMLAHPHAWQRLDDVYRRCRLHRFPYGIVYRIDPNSQSALIVTVMHMSQRPDAWRKRVS